MAAGSPPARDHWQGRVFGSARRPRASRARTAPRTLQDVLWWACAPPPRPAQGPFSITRFSRRSQRKNVEHRGVAGDVGRTHTGLAAMRRRGLRARHGAGLSRYLASLVLPSRPDERLIGTENISSGSRAVILEASTLRREYPRKLPD